MNQMYTPPRQPLAVLVHPANWTVEAFVAEKNVARVRVGDVRAGGPLATVAAIGDSQRQERAPKDAIYPVKFRSFRKATR